LREAIDAGLTRHSLLGDLDYGDVRDDYSIGRVLSVDSVDPEWPSYQLAEIVSDGTVAAIAVVNETDGGLQFGELMAVASGTGLPRQADLDLAIADAGLAGTARLVWGPTDRANPRLAPFLVGRDADTQSSRIVTGRIVEDATTVLGTHVD
jgi:hypothetical protein